MPPALALVALVLTVTTPARVTDDAYITYRYVRNIVTGQGFVYNTGERVLGTTTPLYTLLLAALTYALPRSDVIQLSLAVNAISDALCTVILLRLACWITRSKWNSLIIALLFALFPYRVAIARSGMETPFLVLMILTSIYLYILERPCLSAAVSGLATLTRPEGGLLIPLILLLVLISRKRLPYKEGVAVLALLLPWLLFSTWYFGNPLPNSVVAKARAYVPISRLQFVPIIVRFWGGAPFCGLQTMRRLVYGLSNGIFLISLYVLVLWRACKKRSSASLFWGYPVLFGLAFICANPLVMPWYLAPLLPFWLVGLGKGIVTLANMIIEGDHKPKRALLVVAILSATQIPALDIISKVEPFGDLTQREDLYKALATELKEQISSGCVVAASEIGAFGYYSSAYILDTGGLVSPQAMAYNPAPRSSIPAGAIPTALILDHRPEYVVTLEIFARDALLQSSEFSERYALVRRIDTSASGSHGLLVFRRRD